MANLEVPTETLLNAVVQLPSKEFERFFEQAKRLRQNSTKSRWTKSEIEMIRNLNHCVLSSEKQERFNKLVKKRRAEKITERELAELIILNDESESLNVKRIEILAKLATAKNKTLPEIMDELEIRPPQVI
jgi:hypothetical protein